MKNFHYVPLTLIALAVLSGCQTPTQNASLRDAHESYKTAQANPQVTTLAAVELNQAGVSLNKADAALSKGKDAATVDQLAYIANQQVAIAQAIAERKTLELAVTNASANRNQIRLDARTAEANAAKRQVVIANEKLSLQAEDLAAADANAQSDQAVIVIQEMQIRELNAKQTNRGLVVTLGDVLFNSGMSELKSGGTRNIQKVADFLIQNPQRDVLIEGFTDSVGSATFNQELSIRRAESVRAALIALGISGDRISTEGYGEEHPVAKNDTAAHRQANRRVEIIFSEDNGNIPTM